MGIRPFVAIRQDLSESAPNIQESQLKGILVGPAVQEEDIFSERLNVSSTHGTIATILSDVGTAAKEVSVTGLNSGSETDFDTLSFGGKEIVAVIDPQGTYAASIKSLSEKYILKVDLSADGGVDGKVTIQDLLEKGADSGDALTLSWNDGADKSEIHKVRSLDVVDNAGTDELYITMWAETVDAGIDENTVFTLTETKKISQASLDILAPMTITGNELSHSSYSIDNTVNPVDGGFTTTLYVYLPSTAQGGPDFSNRQITTTEITTLSNYVGTTNVCKVTDGVLYNFFIANRADLSNNIFEVTTDNYVTLLGKASKNNKLSYAMQMIAKEVPGGSMKVYVTADDEPSSYIAALGQIATSDIVYSVTPLTDSPSVLSSLEGMVITAAQESIAKWKMAVACPRVPYFNKKITTDTYTVTQIGATASYYVESVEGGFLTVGVTAGDSIFGDTALDDAEAEYYNQIGESYSAASYATVDSIVTDNKLIVTAYSVGTTLDILMSGQNLVVGELNTFDGVRTIVGNQVESISNHGYVNIFPDKYQATILDEEVLLPGYYMAAITNAVMAHLPPQQGLSNLAYNSIDKVIGSSFKYTDGELDEIASLGVYVIIQETYSSKPYVLRQLTTDMKSLEAMEINKVRCLDYATLGFASVLNDFVGKRNVNDENIAEIKSLLNSAGKTMIKSTRNAFLGSVITTYDIVDVYVPDGEKDAINCVVDVETPTSLNKIRLFVSSGHKGADAENEEEL